MVQGVWPGCSQWFGLCVWDLVSYLDGSARVQPVWPGLDGSGCELLGWFRRGLVSCLGGSGCVAGSSELLGWFRLCGQGLVSCVCLVSILHVLYRMEMK